MPTSRLAWGDAVAWWARGGETVKTSTLIAAALAALAVFGVTRAVSAPRTTTCAACIKADMERLAGDALRGRACGTDDETAAALYIADKLKRSGVTPAFGPDLYLQPVTLQTPTWAAPATLELTSGASRVSMVQGRDMVAMEPPPSLRAPFVRLTDAGDAAKRSGGVGGLIVVLDSPVFDAPGMQRLLGAGALAVITPASDRIVARWADLAARPPGRTIVGDVEPRTGPDRGVTIFANAEAMAALRKLDQGEARLDAPRGPRRLRTTHNVVGVLHGTAPDADRHALLLTAHYDHLGVRNGVIFHGANDDASGTAAVLEFARILGGAAHHRRTVYFGLFGCEEEGELGAAYFQAHPPMAIDDLVANLEFEMIGVDDPKRPGALMLTGWDRTNLGPVLQSHGARLGPDLYPEEHFFQRSDNYQLALHGVVAQTVSAWPIPPTYHAASDDLAHVDLNFMDAVIGSMVGPITWLLDSDFQPEWLPGQKP